MKKYSGIIVLTLTALVCSILLVIVKNIIS